MKSLSIFIFLGWIALAVIARLAPHPANISPMTAMAVFTGAVATRLFGRRAWLAWLAPMIALFISDLILGFYPSAPFVYLGFAAAIVCGQLFRRETGSTAPRIYTLAALTATIAGSTAFFVLSNLGVWFEGVLYPPTVSGFAACYFAAIPFFLKSLSGDLLSALVLFGVWASVRSNVLAYFAHLSKTDSVSDPVSGSTGFAGGKQNG